MSLLSAVLVGLPALCAGAASSAADCNAPGNESLYSVNVPGHPFGVISSPDGCWVFASVTVDSRKEGNGLAVLRRNGNGDVSLRRVIKLEHFPAGMVFTHDGKLLILANYHAVTFFDARKLISADADPVLGSLQTQPNPVSIYVNVTRDDRYLFVADEGASSLTVIDLVKARTTGFTAAAIIGRIPTGVAPIALTFSPDEKVLYTTSQQAADSWGWPAKCTKEGDPTATRIEKPEGAILVIDVEKAKHDPANAVLQRVPSGCSPVRLDIAADGSSVWATIRNNDAVAAYDATKLLKDPEHARIAWIPVGKAPVGIIVTRDGKYVLSANSNRFGSDAKSAQALTVIDRRRAAVLGTIAVGALPRNFSSSRDGKTLLLTNFLSDTVTLIDAERLPYR